MFAPGAMLEANWVILYLVYGQVFFLIGVITYLSARRQSQLELARALPWLAAFGIAHGLNEWGYIFVPLQAQYLPPTAVDGMIVAQLLLLAASFFFLLQFGALLLLSALSRRRWLRVLPAGTFALWAVVLALRLLFYEDSFDTTIALGDAWSRYMLCFSGALLAHFGFLRQARQVRAMGFGRVSRYLVGAAVTFSSYTLVGGLIVPPAPVFPASVLNYDLLNSTLHIPAPVFRSLCGLAMVVFVTRSFEIFQIETDQIIEGMKRTQILSNDRERIGRELHDGIIQSIYGAGLSLEDAQLNVGDQPDVARQRIRTVMEMLNQSITDIRRYIFDLRAVEQARELESVLEDLVHNLRLDTMLDVELEVAGQRCWNLEPDQIAHLIQIAREAVSNAVQHASAKHITIQLHYECSQTQLAVLDDGRGMDPDTLRVGNRGGHGISNIRERVQLIGGTLTLDSTPGRGTRLGVTVPCDCTR